VPSLARPLLLAPLAPVATLVLLCIGLWALASLTGDADIAVAILYIGILPILLFILPMTYLATLMVWILAALVRIDLHTAGARWVVLLTCGVLTAVGYALRWWTGNGVDWWFPALLIPLGLMQSVAFMWHVRATARSADAGT